MRRFAFPALAATALIALPAVAQPSQPEGQTVTVVGQNLQQYRGRLAACRYFFHYELPRIGAWLGVVERRDDTCRSVAEDEF
jgi:hypothetical protein